MGDKSLREKESYASAAVVAKFYGYRNHILKKNIIFVD